MIKSFKYRIFPTKKQTAILNQQLESCRWLYNYILGLRKNSWEIDGKKLTRSDTQSLLPELKLTYPQLQEVNAHALQNVNDRVELAFRAFFRRVSFGEKPGYPRFKSTGRYRSITFPQAVSSCEVKNGRLKVSKVGNLKIKLHRTLVGKLKTATIILSGTGKWYVCFAVDTTPERLPTRTEQVGIDVGLSTFASLSDGQEIPNPRFFRKEEKALSKAHRKLSKSPESGISKKRKALARIHERIHWRRTNFSHQHSRSIVNRFGLIAVEDLTVNRLSRNRLIAKSISDAAWTMFFDMLFYKAEDAGRTIVSVNPAYTSQTCSSCGYRQQMPLDMRTFDCTNCKLSIGRDFNASLNILALGLQSIRNQSVEA